MNHRAIVGCPGGTKTGRASAQANGTNGTNGTHQGFEQHSRKDAKLGRELGKLGWFGGGSGGVRVGVCEDFGGVRGRSLSNRGRNSFRVGLG